MPVDFFIFPCMVVMVCVVSVRVSGACVRVVSNTNFLPLALLKVGTEYCQEPCEHLSPFHVYRPGVWTGAGFELWDTH